jgi:2-methylcitrate dehydratase
MLPEQAPMQRHTVRVHPAAERLPREAQLAWKLAAFASGRPPLEPEALALLPCRVVDNAAVAMAALSRPPVAAARAQALAHPRRGGAALFGLPRGTAVAAEWAAWANATAVRELDYHDTFLAADFAHPGDNIPPLVAAAQQCGRDGRALARAVLVAYEVQVALVKAISLHRYKKDHVAHLAPATVCGLGALLDLPTATVFQAINQAVHLAFSTRQSRKGEISSWKAFVPGFSGKLSLEAVDRAMRGEAAPSPIYEGEDSVIACMLGGPDEAYEVALPGPGEAPRAILETYSKAHSAEYQAQALIDLAIELAGTIDTSRVTEIVLETSHHTHAVIGSGANDPEKYDPEASRETLDHSAPYILAVALEDGRWHHEASYAPERRRRPSTLALWRKIRSVESEEWNRAYHEPDPARRGFGGRLLIRLDGGLTVTAEKRVADAHPAGARPWTWPDYADKFESLTAGIVSHAERRRFLGLARRLADLSADEVRALLPIATPNARRALPPVAGGIFDWPVR